MHVEEHNITGENISPYSYLLRPFGMFEIDDRVIAQLEADLSTHRMAYSAGKGCFIALPGGGLSEEVDATQLLDLLDLAERYDAPIELEGFLVQSYIPATFIVHPDGKVTVELSYNSDYDRAWSLIETEYSMISVMEME